VSEKTETMQEALVTNFKAVHIEKSDNEAEQLTLSEKMASGPILS